MYIEQLKTSILSLTVLTILTGFAYPMAMTGIAQRLFPHQANGSLLFIDGKPVGSHLIGQPFDEEKYFWGRLSATSPVGYNGSASSGSNFGPLNPNLCNAAKDRMNALKKEDPDNANPIPIDLVTASGSGLDPHITPAGAIYQIHRIAKIRHLTESTLQDLIQKNIEGRFFGILGEPRVNVLKLNLSLDELSHGSKT